MTDIEEARTRFEEGINANNARKWRENAKNNSDEYEAEFADILRDQNEAAKETEHLTGYDRLVAYAEHMYEKQGEKNSGGH